MEETVDASDSAFEARAHAVDSLAAALLVLLPASLTDSLANKLQDMKLDSPTGVVESAARNDGEIKDVFPGLAARSEGMLGRQSQASAISRGGSRRSGESDQRFSVQPLHRLVRALL